jgi:hypothetical protein
MTRERLKAWVKANDHHGSFEDAFWHVVGPALDWLTDEQLADIVSEMVRRERHRVHNNLRNRKAMAAHRDASRTVRAA